jgi:hypothetical protein
MRLAIVGGRLTVREGASLWLLVFALRASKRAFSFSCAIIRYSFMPYNLGLLESLWRVGLSGRRAIFPYLFGLPL